MTARFHNSAMGVVAGTTASLALHMLVILPVFTHLMQNSVAESDRRRDFEDQLIDDPAPRHDDESEIELGLEDGSPSTMTWIGYDTYQEHMAMLAPVEQAAFDPNPPSPLAIPTPPTPPSQAASEIAPETLDPEELVLQEPKDQDARTTTTVTVDPLEVQTPAEFETDPSASPLPNTRRDTAETLARVMETLSLQASFATRFTDRRRPSDAETADLAEVAGPAQQVEPNPETKKDPSEVAKAEDTKGDQPRTAPPTDAGSPTQGNNADRESDPTSIEEVPFDKIISGQPLAARGLEVRTRKPSFTVLQSLKGIPKNPLVEIRFGRDGRPQRCVVLESSGSASFDESILSSLYRWRASGEVLEELGKDETIPVVIQLLLR